MFDGFFELTSTLLNVFYGLVPNYAVAIALLTLCVMVLTTPLTLKGTRSMIEMQRLQPELRRLQVQFRDDRVKLNEELMKFYREHNLNPLGGCLPLLVQAPIFSLLFYVVRGLTNEGKFIGLQNAVATATNGATRVLDGFSPKYLDHTDELYQALLGESEMKSFGVDLSRSASQALGDGLLDGLPYLAIVGLIAFLAWYQQKQIMGRSSNADMPPQQKMLMRIGPAIYIVFAFASPAALAVYFLVSTAWRVGQQAYITRSLYRGEDSIGAQAQRAAAELRKQRAAEGANGRRGTPAQKAPAKRAGNAGNGTSVGDGEQPVVRTPHPRSRKKRKRK